MSETIFREKSLEKVKSPDNLNEYIRVSNPGVWILMASIIFLLVGFCVWSVFGNIRTTIKADAHCENGVITCYLPAQDAESVKLGMEAKIGNQTGTIAEVNLRNDGTSTCTISVETPMEDGIFDVEIEVESIRPMSFLVN